MNDYSEACDYNSLKSEIRKVLKTYFETDDDGNANTEYDENFSAQDALDAIRNIVKLI